MNRIILVTILPGLYANHDNLITFKTVKYEDWLIVNKNWQKHTDQIVSVIADLHMISLQYKDVLKEENLIIFSCKNWNDLGSNLIRTNFYVHLDMNLYTHENMSLRAASQNVFEKISDFSRWNNNCCRMRERNSARSFILKPTELLNYANLQLASKKTSFFSVNAIENFNLLVQSEKLTK